MWNKVYAGLSLAQKAGRVASGGYAAEAAVRSGSACLVLVAEDASGNTKKKMKNMAAYYEVPFYLFGTKEELGHCIGKEYRSMLAVQDEGFAKSLIKQIETTMR